MANVYTIDDLTGELNSKTIHKGQTVRVDSKKGILKDILELKQVIKMDDVSTNSEYAELYSSLFNDLKIK